MNRRGFIGTITALAGIVLARIKAPAAPQDYLRHTYTGDFRIAKWRQLGSTRSQMALLEYYKRYGKFPS